MFSAVRIRGLAQLQRTVESSPVLVISNHTAWWDPMFCILIGHKLLSCDAYAMMDAKNLKRLPFLGRVGGFGFHLDDASDRKRAIGYTQDLLSRQARLVWIFPQGAERPRCAPLDDFKPGAAIIALRNKAVQVIPVGIRYEFQNLEKPMAFVSIGKPIVPMQKVETAVVAQQKAVQRELDFIDSCLIEGAGRENFREFYRSSTQNFVEKIAERILAFFTRYSETKNER